MSDLATHCTKLESIARMINYELETAIAITKEGPLSAEEANVIAHSFAAGISQIAMVKLPLIDAALELETAAAVAAHAD